MIKRKGDLFTSTADFLGHGVNCKGVMGAGIAKTFKEKYPVNYQFYRHECTSLYAISGIEIGGPAFIWKEHDKWIVNMPTQDKPGANATYDAVFSTGDNVAKRVLEIANSRDNIAPVVAIPQIGCGIGGLVWENVEPILRTVEILNPGFEWEVWKYDG